MNQQFPSYPNRSQLATPPQTQPAPPPYYPQQPVQAQPQQPPAWPAQQPEPAPAQTPQPTTPTPPSNPAQPAQQLPVQQPAPLVVQPAAQPAPAAMDANYSSVFDGTPLVMATPVSHYHNRTVFSQVPCILEWTTGQSYPRHRLRPQNKPNGRRGARYRSTADHQSSCRGKLYHHMGQWPAHPVRLCWSTCPAADWPWRCSIARYWWCSLWAQC